MKNNICMIITAAGMARRNPGKLVHKIDGQPAISKVLSVYYQLPLDIFLVTGPRHDELLKSVNPAYLTGIKIIRNDKYSTGLSSSVRAGTSAAGRNYKYYGYCNGDKPFIRQSSVIKLLDRIMKDDPEILVPTYMGTCGHPVFFQQKYYHELNHQTGDIGARKIIQKYHINTLFTPVSDEGITLDLDKYLTQDS